MEYKTSFEWDIDKAKKLLETINVNDAVTSKLKEVISYLLNVVVTQEERIEILEGQIEEIENNN